jgi:hypothetical protein
LVAATQEAGEATAAELLDVKDALNSLTDLMDRGGYALGGAVNNIDGSLWDLAWYVTPRHVRLRRRAGELIRKWRNH